MTPFLWLIWVILALIVLFIAAAVVHTIIEKYRELPPRRRHSNLENVTAVDPRWNAKHIDHVHWAMKPDADELIYDPAGSVDPPKTDGSER